ncbi:hypothetical protein GS507_01425 [Rhodococcus hoagii]|nr:hypothetical protein [Prescottella equi]
MDFPRHIFDETDQPPLDVAVFDYPSGGRRLLKTRPNIPTVGRSLSQLIPELSKIYPQIVFAAHSLGGLISLNATKIYLDDYQRNGGIINAVAGLTLFGVPLSGSLRAKRFLSPAFGEVRYLRRNAPHQQELHTYFSNRVEISRVNPAGNRDYFIPIYSGVAANDFWVAGSSSTFSIPSRQIKTFQCSHTDLVKPNSSSDSQVVWLRECAMEISKSRQDLRQTLNNNRHRTKSATSIPPISPPNLVVTELVLEPDSGRYEEIYQKLLDTVPSTSVSVRDRSQVNTSVETSLLISIHRSSDIISRKPLTITSIADAHSRYEAGACDVRIAAIGPGYEEARDTIYDITAYSYASQKKKFYVDEVADTDQLAHVMSNWMTLAVRKAERDLQATLFDVGGNNDV